MPDTLDIEALINKLLGHQKMVRSLGNAQIHLNAITSIGKTLEDDMKRFIEGLSEDKRAAAKIILFPEANDPWTYYGRIIDSVRNLDAVKLRGRLTGVYEAEHPAAAKRSGRGDSAIHQTNVETFDQLINVATKVISEQGSLTWFRGHAIADWPLVPSVFRHGHPPIYECYQCGSFMQQARSRYAKCPEERDRDKWLTLMRHYGLPTRLQDWSKSVLVAAYFALQMHDDHPAAIWILDPVKLNVAQIGEPNVGSMAGGGITGALLAAAFAPIPVSAESLQKTIAVAPFEIDPRMMAQQSMMTLHGSRQPMDKLNGADQFLQKLVVPASAKPKIRRVLEQIGIRESSLFPDLEHLANDVIKTVETDYQILRAKT